MKADEEGLVMKHFILKPEGNDKYAYASRRAMWEYAMVISHTNSKLSRDLQNWVLKEVTDIDGLG